MLYTIKDLQALKLTAVDEPIGTVTDVFFDDQDWRVRYFVVNTGSWMRERDVLVSSMAVKTPSLEEGVLVTTLTREQVAGSPPVERHLPVSRQYEEALHTYYGWQPYWLLAAVDPLVGVPPLSPQTEWQSLTPEIKEILERERQARQLEDSHLRSCEEVRNYKIHARDGRIGRLDDFLVSDTTWLIEELIVDTRTLLPGGKVHFSKDRVRGIDWAAQEISVDAWRSDIERAAPVNFRTPVTPQEAGGSAHS
jgi:hypothetical protein